MAFPGAGTVWRYEEALREGSHDMTYGPQPDYEWEELVRPRRETQGVPEYLGSIAPPCDADKMAEMKAHNASMVDEIVDAATSAEAAEAAATEVRMVTFERVKEPETVVGKYLTHHGVGPKLMYQSIDLKTPMFHVLESTFVGVVRNEYLGLPMEDGSVVALSTVNASVGHAAVYKNGAYYYISAVYEEPRKQVTDVWCRVVVTADMEELVAEERKVVAILGRAVVLYNVDESSCMVCGQGMTRPPTYMRLNGNGTTIKACNTCCTKTTDGRMPVGARVVQENVKTVVKAAEASSASESSAPPAGGKRPYKTQLRLIASAATAFTEKHGLAGGGAAERTGKIDKHGVEGGGGAGDDSDSKRQKMAAIYTSLDAERRRNNVIYADESGTARKGKAKKVIHVDDEDSESTSSEEEYDIPFDFGSKTDVDKHLTKLMYPVHDTRRDLEKLTKLEMPRKTKKALKKMLPRIERSIQENRYAIEAFWKKYEKEKDDLKNYQEFKEFQEFQAKNANK